MCSFWKGVTKSGSLGPLDVKFISGGPFCLLICNSFSVIIPSMPSKITHPKTHKKYQFLYHFLPHQQNKTRARLLSHGALLTYLAMVAIMLGFFLLVPKLFPGVLGYASSINIKDLFNGTNKIRVQNNLSELRLNSELSKAAQEKAKDMFKYNYWAHVSPTGTEPWDFILAQNYDYMYAGENLAKNFNDSKGVVDAWYRSPSHRENLLSPNYDEVGYAAVNGVLDGYETTLVVQLFGRPRNLAQIATVQEQDNLLNNSQISRSALARNPATVPAVLPALDVSLATNTLSFAIGGFLIFLLILDIWYSRKKGILKFTGHTFAHITFLVLVLLGLWITLSPGRLI